MYRSITLVALFCVIAFVSASDLNAVSRMPGSCSNYCFLGDVQQKQVRQKCRGSVKYCTRPSQGSGKPKKGIRCDCSGPKPPTASPPTSNYCDSPYMSTGRKWSNVYVNMKQSEGQFSFYWGLYVLKDKVTIYQGGYKIFSTESPIGGYGVSTVKLNGKSNIIRVQVSSQIPGSMWDFYPTCPEYL